MAKLHIICSRCGSNNAFTYKIDDDFCSQVVITCKNCSGTYYLEDNAEKEEEEDE